jgi:dTDP-4-amino-4,6-dideoxygalactose transaminase
MTRALCTADPCAGFMSVREELIATFQTVLESGRYILAEHVAAFEREWSAYCETTHAVGVSSGTDALALALRALGVGPGDEVLVPAMTAVATWMAVSQIGAVPVGVDIEAERNGMDPAKAAAAIGRRTRALVAVHLFGRPADIEPLLEVASAANIPLVEDAAQAHGARLAGQRVGSLGSAAAFSFYPTKNLGAMGDAGAITTSDPALAERARLLREYGWRTREDAELRGVNARLDELQAALLRVMLPRMQAGIARRQAIASAYRDRLADVAALELPGSTGSDEPAWHLFVVRHPRRDALAARVASAGVQTAVHYRTPPHMNSAFAGSERRAGVFPVAERHAARALTLPMHPWLSDADVVRVTDAVRSAATRD